MKSPEKPEKIPIKFKDAVDAFLNPPKKSRLRKLKELVAKKKALDEYADTPSKKKPKKK